MPDVVSCPEAADLEKIALGDLSIECSEELLQHISVCPRCAACLDSIVAEDALVAALRCGDEASRPEQEVVGRLLDSVRGLVADTRNEADDRTTPAVEP